MAVWASVSIFLKDAQATHMSCWMIFPLPDHGGIVNIPCISAWLHVLRRSIFSSIPFFGVRCLLQVGPDLLQVNHKEEVWRRASGKHFGIGLECLFTFTPKTPLSRAQTSL